MPPPSFAILHLFTLFLCSPAPLAELQ
uniref:Uncharacterized protein n=1 Tax=Anguilla anguilla TaxID=7936 RepID=A0A0E9PA25_ANGAN